MTGELVPGCRVAELYHAGLFELQLANASRRHRTEIVVSYRRDFV